MCPLPASPAAPDDDLDLVTRITGNDTHAFEALMRRYNGRLFRVARAILRDDAEAEDALQDAYLDAFRHISDFHGASRLATWLTRIVINHALMRLRKQRRHRVVVPMTRQRANEEEPMEREIADDKVEPPATSALRSEIRKLLERRIDELPISFRTVFVMREVEEMTVEETAEALAIPSATVRTRLFRARALLRASLADDIDNATIDVFAFAGPRCDRIVATVMSRLRET